MGGLPRRNTVLEEARKKGDLLVLDGGRSLAPLTPSRVASEQEQRRAKAELIARAWRRAGIDAMALGGSDWALGTDFVRGLAEREQLPILAANLTCGGSSPFPGGKVFEQQGRRIGVVGLTDGTVEGCEVTDAREALVRAIAALGPVDFRVALVPLDSDRTLAAFANPGAESAADVPTPLPVDLVVDARGRFPEAGPDERGGTRFLGGGMRGKKVAFLDLEFVEGAAGFRVDGATDKAKSRGAVVEARIAAIDRRIDAATDMEVKDRLIKQRLGYQQQLEAIRAEAQQPVSTGPQSVMRISAVDLGTEIADHAATLAMVTETKQAITALAAQNPSTFVPRVVADATSPFAGGEACVACHAQEHAQWSTTDHSRAWAGLVDDERAFDEACWSCHVTGARAEGGPADAQSTAGFRDVQCEACHGPSRAHVAAPSEIPSPVAAPGQGQCVTCHDGEQDQGRFDWPTYLPKVVHGPAGAPDADPPPSAP